LLSGGLDSAVTLGVAKRAGFVCHALTIDYGQRHRAELAAAAAVAKHVGAASHRVLNLDLRAIGGSALTADIAVPKDRAEPEAKTDSAYADSATTHASPLAGDIPVTYVPARNLVFLSLAAGLAETLGGTDLFVGVNAVDYSGYPDCRPEFIAALRATLDLATKAGTGDRTHAAQHWSIHTPLVHLSKAAIIRLGVEVGVDLGLTHSCYDPVLNKSRGAGFQPAQPATLWRACGHCDSCIIRRRGFAEAGVPDPTPYV
jgi:7-cyano-7-deazaguanine synthase